MEGRGPIWQGLVGIGEFWSYSQERCQTEGSDRRRRKPLYFFVDIFWGSRFQSRWCGWRSVEAPSGQEKVVGSHWLWSQQVTRVAWSCDKGLGNAVLTPWQPLSRLSKFRSLQPGFALQSSSLSAHPQSQGCSFCPRGFMASQISSSIKHVVPKEVSPRACPAPPILLILAPYCEAGSVMFFLFPACANCFLSLSHFPWRGNSPEPAYTREKPPPKRLALLSPVSQLGLPTPCGALPWGSGMETSGIRIPPDGGALLPSFPPWGRGKRGEASQNLEPPRTGPSTPLLLGLGHYSLLNRAVCEETRGVNTVITWPELGKEWKHGILNLHVESFSHALCQRQRKLLWLRWHLKYIFFYIYYIFI